MCCWGWSRGRWDFCTGRRCGGGRGRRWRHWGIRIWTWTVRRRGGGRRRCADDAGGEDGGADGGAECGAFVSALGAIAGGGGAGGAGIVGAGEADGGVGGAAARRGVWDCGVDWGGAHGISASAVWA